MKYDDYKAIRSGKVQTKLGCAEVFVLGKPLFGSRQLKVAEMAGRGAPNSETTRKRSAGAVDDQNGHKSPIQKNDIFAPLKTNGRADGNQKTAFPHKKCDHWSKNLTQELMYMFSPYLRH